MNESACSFENKNLKPLRLIEEFSSTFSITIDFWTFCGEFLSKICSLSFPFWKFVVLMSWCSCFFIQNPDWSDFYTSIFSSLVTITSWHIVHLLSPEHNELFWSRLGFQKKNFYFCRNHIDVNMGRDRSFYPLNRVRMVFDWSLEHCRSNRKRQGREVCDD